MRPVWVLGIILSVIAVSGVLFTLVSERLERERFNDLEVLAGSLTPSSSTTLTAFEQWEREYPEAAVAFDKEVRTYQNSSDPSVTDIDVTLAYDKWAEAYPDAEEAREYALTLDMSATLQEDHPEFVAGLRSLEEQYPRQMREFMELGNAESPASRLSRQEWGQRPENLDFVRSFSSHLQEYLWVSRRIPLTVTCYLLYEESCPQLRGIPSQ